MNLIKKSLVVILLISIFSFENGYSQNLDIELLFGIHSASTTFDHPTPVLIGDATADPNAHFGLALSSPIGKSKFFLRSELGYTATNGTLDLEYTIDIGQGPQEQDILTKYKNTRIYLGISPEYRFIFSKIGIRLNAGPIIHTDISNTSEAIFESLFDAPSASNNGDLLVGFKVGTGVLISLNNLGLSLNASYLRFEKSEIFNFYDPKIIYNHFQGNIGIIYSIRGSQSE